jgi:hypothetical protein
MGNQGPGVVRLQGIKLFLHSKVPRGVRQGRADRGWHGGQLRRVEI